MKYTIFKQLKTNALTLFENKTKHYLIKEFARYNFYLNQENYLNISLLANSITPYNKKTVIAHDERIHVVL